MNLVKRRRLSTGNIDISADEYSSAGTKAIDSQFKVYDAAAQELRGRLEKRIGKLRREERGTLAVIIFSILLALAIAYFITRAITRPIKNLMEGMRVVGEGRLDHRLTHEGGDDEFASLSGSFNRMTARLEHTTASKEEMESEIVEASRLKMDCAAET